MVLILNARQSFYQEVPRLTVGGNGAIVTFEEPTQQMRELRQFLRKAKKRGTAVLPDGIEPFEDNDSEENGSDAEAEKE